MIHWSHKEKANEKNNYFCINARGIDEHCYGGGVGSKSTLQKGSGGRG
jgi:hypothetical protein